MSPEERAVRHDKLRTDRAISQAYRSLTGDACARNTFDVLIGCVRTRSPRLLQAPAINGRHPGVDALVNLARCTGVHVRAIADWAGSSASWRGGVNGIAQHLVSAYRVPAFLSAAWFATDRYADAKRRWFIGHAGGVRLRSLSLPIRLTRKMEDILLGSRDHFGIEYALRRAELLGLGADQDLTDAVLEARPALDLDNSEFWRSVWLFLVANAHAIDRTQIGPMIDFLHAVRIERVAVHTPEGLVMREPPQPYFSLKGRTVRSMLRLMEAWHRSLGSAGGGLRWQPSRLRPMVIESPPQDPSAPPVFWELTELTTSAQLRAEGAALRHCVASYAYRCSWGASRIWSLRRRRDTAVRSVATVEVDTATKTIVQARGFRNRRAPGRALELVKAWAQREHLRLGL